MRSQSEQRQEREQWEQENAIAEVNRRIQNQMFQRVIDFDDEDEQDEDKS